MSDGYDRFETPCATCKLNGIPVHKETGEFIVLKEYGRPVGSCQWKPPGPDWWVRHELSKVSWESMRTFVDYPVPFECPVYEEADRGDFIHHPSVS